MQKPSANSASSAHVPVLFDETIALLQIRPGFDAVDGTVGDGGHARAVLAKSAPNGRLLALDRDPISLERAREKLIDFSPRTIFAHAPASRMGTALARIEPRLKVRAIVLDLGFALHQIHDARRGFSFALDGPLDMRYDPTTGGATAADILQRATREELTQLFRTFGEERFARPIAEAIVRGRQTKPLQTTRDLTDGVLAVYRRKLHSTKEIPWVGGRHPATNVFQALRIAVNDELGELHRALQAATDALTEGGRLAVISFHSGEDRIVKRFFRENDRLTPIIKKPIRPSQEERERNPAARSAKLRIAEKHTEKNL